MDWKVFAIVISSVVGAVALAFAVLAIVSRKVYNRSVMATLVALYLRLTTRHKSQEELMADIAKSSRANDVPYSVPRRVRTRFQQTVDYHGMTVVCVNMAASVNRAVVYLHGGAYVRQPRIYHWKYINKLASRVGNVIVPIYPLAPNSHPMSAFSLLTELYLELKDRYGEVILMGDSAGGGLALSLLQQWSEVGYEQPRKTILFSPWMDVTMSNTEIERYKKIDPFVTVEGARVWGKAWAQDMSLNDFRISPLYGNMKNLGEVVVYSGDREILYPDFCRLRDKMKDSANFKFVVGRGMNHVYQVYPIPEARKALDEVVREISEPFLFIQFE